MKRENLLLTVIDNDDDATTVGRAAELAVPLGASIELFSCCYDEHIAGTRFFDTADQAAARDSMVNAALTRLDEMAGPLREKGLEVSTHACWDRPEHEAVVRRAVATRARMVLRHCGFHNAISRAIFSHEDWQLIRTSPCPLLLVKKAKPYQAAPRLWAAVDPMHAHEKPESLDKEILALATSLATSLNADLDVVHSYDPASALAAAAAPAVIPAPLPLDRITEEMRDRHSNSLHSLTDKFCIDRDRVHNLSGSARTVLTAVTIENKADVLIMGAVARTGFDKLIIGSTAEKILDHVPCDVLIVKPESLYASLSTTMSKGVKTRFVA